MGNLRHVIGIEQDEDEDRKQKPHDGPCSCSARNLLAALVPPGLFHLAAGRLLYWLEELALANGGH